MNSEQKLCSSRRVRSFRLRGARIFLRSAGGGLGWCRAVPERVVFREGDAVENSSFSGASGAAITSSNN